MVDRYLELSIRMKAQFKEARTVGERQRIVNEFVSKLRAAGFSDKEIIDIGKKELLLDSQGNRIMISNTEAYKQALAKALGVKK